MRRFQKPLADIVICGSGPNLINVLEAPRPVLVSLIRIGSIMRPYGSSPSHTPTGSVQMQLRSTQAVANRTGSR